MIHTSLPHRHPSTIFRTGLTTLLLYSSLDQIRLVAYDELLNYRPPLLSLWEPHIAQDGLSSLALNLNHGSTTHGRDSQGAPAPLFATWQPGPSCSRTISCPHKFSDTEIIAVGYQNFIKGLFVGLYIPARFLHIRNAPAGQGRRSVAYESRKKGLGDIAWSFGWAYNYEETTRLDFIDLTIQTGVALPTSKAYAPLFILEPSIGYQGHTGFFGIIDSSFGAFDWLTLGAHLQGIGFSPCNVCIPAACFPPRLAEAAPCAPTTIQEIRRPGMVVGLYGKADHVLLGLSITFGYSFMHQGARYPSSGSASTLLPTRCSTFFESWSMHTLHTSIDYDCATYLNPHAPRIALTYNTVVAGTRIIQTPLFQGSLDCMIAFKF